MSIFTDLLENNPSRVSSPKNGSLGLLEAHLRPLLQAETLVLFAARPGHGQRSREGGIARTEAVLRWSSRPVQRHM